MGASVTELTTIPLLIRLVLNISFIRLCKTLCTYEPTRTQVIWQVIRSVLSADTASPLAFDAQVATASFRGENDQDASGHLVKDNCLIVFADKVDTKLDNIIRPELARLRLDGFGRQAGAVEICAVGRLDVFDEDLYRRCWTLWRDKVRKSFIPCHHLPRSRHAVC